MSANTTVVEFNTSIVKGNVLGVKLEEYFDKYKAVFRREDESYDDEFEDYFLSLVYTADDFCVHHDDLIKYGVITPTQTSGNIKTLLTSTHRFKEGIDFIVHVETVNEGKNGRKNKNVYTMKPRVFKKCLVRSRNTSKYADYYMNLEEVHAHYKDYQKMYSDYEKSGLIKEVKEQRQIIEEQARKADEERAKAAEERVKAEERAAKADAIMEEQRLRINALLGFATDAKEDAEIIKTKLEETNEKLEETNEKLDMACEQRDAIEENASIQHDLLYSVYQTTPNVS